MVAAEAFSRGDGRPLDERREEQAGGDRLAVDERRARAAHADAAGLADGPDAELGAKHREEARGRRHVDLYLLAVEVENDIHGEVVPESARSARVSCGFGA
jgi:hypothetical protein